MSDAPTLPPGMTVRPALINSPGWKWCHGPAWAGLISFAVTKNEYVERFQKDTKHDITFLAKPRSVFDILIDKQTGRESAVFAAWCDWVTINLWGVEGSENDRPVSPKQKSAARS